MFPNTHCVKRNCLYFAYIESYYVFVKDKLFTTFYSKLSVCFNIAPKVLLILLDLYCMFLILSWVLELGPTWALN